MMKRKIAYGCVLLLLMSSVCYMGHAQSEAQQAQPVAQPKKKAEPPPYDPRVPDKEKEKGPDKKDDKSDGPPKVVGVDEDPGATVATLPINLVRNRLENMKDGTKAYISVDNVKVDGKRRVWLHPHALLGPKSGERPLMVSKEPAGYTVTIESTAYQWDAEDFDPGQIKWLAVRNLVTK